MPHITIEYVILLPVLILQIFLFPLSASLLMNIWVNSRRALALQEVASHIGSSIQQLYFALNHTAVTAQTVTQKVDVPPFIENCYYVGNATLKPLNASQLLELTFRLIGTGTTAKASVILGPNAAWRGSTFVSNSTNACITAEKLADGTIRLGFGG
ncbi:MAG: hypothetical protein QW270_07310 [Candidatus Bathyarchaeia archaeon]